MNASERREIIRGRADAHPEGQPAHRFTQGFTKADALQFWVDAQALGLVTVGKTDRGARLMGYPPEHHPTNAQLARVLGLEDLSVADPPEEHHGQHLQGCVACYLETETR